MLFGRCDLCGEVASGGLCASCRARLAKPELPVLRPEIELVVAVFAYAASGAVLVRRLKFANQRRCLPLLVEAALPDLSEVDALVPVPADQRRRRRRGYDLPELLARRVSRRLGVPLGQPLRRVDRGSQRGRGGLDRRRVSGYEAIRSIQGRVLLIDDVVTTGSTARHCAAELRRAGATAVDLFVLAVTASGASSSPSAPTATITA